MTDSSDIARTPMSSVVSGNHPKNISQKYCELSCQLYGLSGFAG